MTRRSRAREVALQLLFLRDFNASLARDDLEQFVRERLHGDKLRTFCWQLYDGVVEHLTTLDAHIETAAENWSLQRMPATDRNVLRLGAFELLHAADTPDPVAFDEAIELAKRFGSADSSAFVNGVLDQVRQAAVSKEAGD